MNRVRNVAIAALGSAVVAGVAWSSHRPVPTSLSVPAVAVHVAGAVEGPYLGLPVRIAVAGEKLLVLDAASATALHIVDRRTGALVESLGPRGEGPGEFQGARSIDVLPGDSAFWVHDVNLQRSTRFRLAPPVDGRREDRVAVFRDGLGVLEPIRVGNGRVVATGLFEGGRLGHFDAGTNLLHVSAKLPSMEGSLPPSTVQFIHQGRFVGSPSRDRFAASSVFFSRIELFDARGESAGMVRSPVPLSPAIMHKRRGEHSRAFVDPQAALGYIDLAATETSLYALFSGRNRRDHPDSAGFGTEVHVFTWEGEFIGAVDLGRDVLAIAVVPDGSEIYGIAHAPAPHIVRGELPEFGGWTRAVASEARM